MIFYTLKDFSLDQSYVVICLIIYLNTIFSLYFLVFSCKIEMGIRMIDVNLQLELVLVKLEGPATRNTYRILE